MTNSDRDAAHAGRDRLAAAAAAELQQLRSSIDNIDAAVVYMLAERFKCTQRVGQLKAEQDLPAADPARESRQIARLRVLAEEARLDPAFAEKLLNFIIAEVIRHHETLAHDSQHPDGGGRGTVAAGHRPRPGPGTRPS